MAIIGFIGTGEIASAMVNGITNQGHKIYVSKRGIKSVSYTHLTLPTKA